MEIIPAIDLRGGRCVRLFQGNYDKETVFSNDPIDVAVRWEREGAKRLHVVDLDGAKEGFPKNIDAVAKIAKSVNIPIQMGGGIRTLEIAKLAVDSGVQRVVIGTSAAKDPNAFNEIVNELGEKVVVGIDARNGRVAVQGWLDDTGIPALDFAKEMEKLGAKRIIFTDIIQDGAMSGVNIESIKAILEAVGIPVIAAGGVTSIEDILRLKDLEPLGLEGVIAGRSIYEGSLRLIDALAIA